MGTSSFAEGTLQLRCAVTRRATEKRNLPTRPSLPETEVAMRRFIVLAFALGLVPSLFAGDDTQSLLEARVVRQQIVMSFQPTGAPPITYVVDGRGNGVLLDEDTFASPALVNFAYKNFNPLKIAIEAKETSAPEPTIKGLSDFLDALVATAKGVIPGGATESGPRTLVLTPDTADSVCQDTRSNIQIAFTKISRLETLTVSDADRARWVGEATGLTGVKAAKLDIDKSRSDLEEALKDADPQVAFLKSIAQIPPASALSPAVSPAAKADAEAKEKLAAGGCIDAKTLACFDDKTSGCLKTNALAGLDNKTLAAIGYMAAKAGDIIAERRKTVQALKQLVSMLEPFADSDNWLTPNDYIFFRSASSPDLMKTITITFKSTAVTPALGVAAAPESSAARKIYLRQYRHFVPELGVAGVYNDLRYPKYKVNDESGKMIVRQDGFDTSHVDAAMTLNLLINAGTKFVYPGIQIGVSKAKDYPGVLGGFVFRFAGFKKFALGVGRMATWYKDLDTLQIGSEVKSPNDLKADLKQRRAPTVTYFAAQFTF
jgi:hypothetical protein